MILVDWGLACAQAAGSQRHILVVNSEGTLLPVVAEMNQSVARTIKAEFGADTEVFIEWLDTNRFSDPERMDHLAEMLQKKYAPQKITGIIAVTESSLNFLAKYREQLFPGVPIVHMTVREAAADKWNTQPGIYGAEVDYDPAALIAFIRKVHPSVRRMVILTGISHLDRAWETFLRERASLHAPTMQFDFWVGLPMAEMLSRARDLKEDCVIYTPGIICDGAGEWMIGIEAVKKIALASSRPVYSPFGQIVADAGAMGGIGPDFAALGPQAAHILAKVLAGDAAEVKGTVAPQKGYFNWGQLRKWGIKEGDLPPDSQVLHRVPGFLELYWPWVVSGVAVILMQSGFITALLIQRRQRRLAETALAEHRQQLTHLTRVSMLGELSGALSHEFSQPLASILVSARAAQRLAEQHDGPPEMSALLQNLLNAGNRATRLLDRLRAMIRREPPRKEPHDLNALARDTLKLMRSEFSVRQIRVVSDLPDMPIPVFGDTVQIQQVLMNVIHNACEAMAGQPADTRELRVQSRAESDDTAQLSVTDRGKGMTLEERERMFDPFFTNKPTGLGLGMSICRQIVQEHQGSIQAENHGHGVTVVLRLPLLTDSSISA